VTSQPATSSAFWRAPAGGLTALILAGSRGVGDPLAVYAGVSHKALIEIDGTPMIERVVVALAAVAGIARIVISIELPELIAGLSGVQAAANGLPIEVLKSAASPSRSVAAALDHCGTPLLVTTADHALLQAEWISYFLGHIPADADAAVALANKAAILEAVPDTARTYLRFADDHYSGCNLFLFATPAAAGAVHFWREVEAERKRPWRMLRRLGLGFALRYAIGKLPLNSAIARLGELSGTRAAVVKMPFGRAAVDVDKPADLDLVQRLLAQDRKKNQA
jgi:GTP:adenosylcobinamide-phosphate guanylyltransferase